MIRYFAYVNWPDVPSYEAAGWRHPETQVSYPRLEEHGTTMEWRGEGEPPMPLGEPERDPDELRDAIANGDRPKSIDRLIAEYE